MSKTKRKTSIEKADDIFKKNAVKAAMAMISLMDCDDEKIKLSATNYVIERIINQPIIIVVDKPKKNST